MKYLLPTILTALLVSASCTTDKHDGKTPSLNLAANISADTSSPLKVSELTYALLGNDSAAAFFKDAVMVDVVGDTAVLVEKVPDMSRLILYNLKDGQYLGQINHRGQGPGEYRIILGAFVNDKDGTVLIPDFDSPSVFKYSLAADTLVGTIEREMVMAMTPPIGGVATAISVAAPTAEGLMVSQYNGDYKLSDSIVMQGFRGGNFNMLWANAGVNGITMDADTLCTLLPGEATPTAIFNRGEYALNLEKDREITMKAMEGADELELLKPYILIRDVQYTDGKILVTSMYDGQKYSDLYDMADGSLLYRNSYDRLYIPSYIVIEGENGDPIHVQSLFAKDGRWYGIVGEEYIKEYNDGIHSQDPGTENPDAATKNMNCAIVSFRL